MERLTLLKTFLNIKEILPIRWSERRGNFGRLDHFVKFPNMATAALDYVNNLSFEGETWKDTFDEELKELINFPNGKTFRPTYGKVRPTQSDIEQEKTRIITAIYQFVMQVKTSLQIIQNNADKDLHKKEDAIPKVTIKRPKAKKQRGRNKEFFPNCIIDPNLTKILIPILEELIKDKEPKDAMCVIIACVNRWITRPSPIAIQRQFNINKTSAQDRLQCQYDTLEKPKYKPYTNTELEPYRKIIEERINKSVVRKD